MDLIYAPDYTGFGWALYDPSGLWSLREAVECKTWDEYAGLIGYEWDEFFEMWENEIREITKVDDPGPDTPFEYMMTLAWYVGDLIDDPRGAAYDTLVRAVKREFLDKVRAEGKIELGGASPGGHLGLAQASSPEDFDRLAQMLEEEGYELRIGRDEEWERWLNALMER